MEPTNAPVSSTSQPSAKESPAKAPGAAQVDPNVVDPDPKIGEIEGIEDILYDIGSALLRDAQDTASRFKLMTEMNKLSERKHRQLMVEQRLKLERERFEHRREIERQAMEVRRQEVEIKHHLLEMKRQEAEAKREKGKGKAGFEAAVPVQAPSHAGAKLQTPASSPETAIQDRETAVRGFEGGRSKEAGAIRKESEAVVKATGATKDAAGTLRMNVPPSLNQKASQGVARGPRIFGDKPGDKLALRSLGSLKENKIHGLDAAVLPAVSRVGRISRTFDASATGKTQSAPHQVKTLDKI